MARVDAGELLLTNKRLVFNGGRRSTNLPLSGVVAGTS